MSPDSASTGAWSRAASYRPATRCVLPGPVVPQQTPRRPVSLACPAAASAAPSSCRTPIHSILLRRTASPSGLRESPIRPKICRTPISSSTPTRTSATIAMCHSFVAAQHVSKTKRRPRRTLVICCWFLLADNEPITGYVGLITDVLTGAPAARWIGLIVHGDGGHASQRQRAPRIAARRPRGLYRQREGRRRHHAPSVPQRRADGGGALRHEGRSGASRRDDLRGGWRPPFDLFPARALARGFAAAHDRPSAYCRFHLRPVRALAGPRRLLHHRHGDEFGRAARA